MAYFDIYGKNGIPFDSDKKGVLPGRIQPRAAEFMGNERVTALFGRRT